MDPLNLTKTALGLYALVVAASPTVQQAHGPNRCDSIAVVFFLSLAQRMLG